MAVAFGLVVAGMRSAETGECPALLLHSTSPAHRQHRPRDPSALREGGAGAAYGSAVGLGVDAGVDAGEEGPLQTARLEQAEAAGAAAAAPVRPALERGGAEADGVDPGELAKAKAAHMVLQQLLRNPSADVRTSVTPPPRPSSTHGTDLPDARLHEQRSPTAAATPGAEPDTVAGAAAALEALMDRPDGVSVAQIEAAMER
eukprot:72832-Chlamydomonas_euryale.AAC.17